MESKNVAIGLTAFCVILAGLGITLIGCDEQVASAPVPAPSGGARVPPPAVAQPDPPPPGVTSKPPIAPAPAPAAAVNQNPQNRDTGEDFFPDMPEFVRGLVDEPEMPMDLDKGEKYDYMALRDGGGFVFEREGKDGERVSGVVIPGSSLVTKGFVELFGCGEGGKTHETIFRLECDILALDTGFTLAGFKRGPLPEKLGIADPKQGERIIALIQWHDDKGKILTRRSEDMVLSSLRKTPMPRVGWTYVGHWIEVPDPTSEDPDRKHKILGAAQSRSLVTTFRDQTSLLDCPLADAIDDSSFLSNYMVVPRSGTPIRVIFRTATKAEREEIALLEKEALANPFVPGEHGHDPK